MSSTFIPIRPDLLQSPADLALVTFALSILTLGCIFLEWKTRDGTQKLKGRAVMYPVTILAYVLILTPLLAPLGVEVSDDVVKVYHTGCGSYFIGIPCEERFSKSDIVNVTIVDWSRSTYCKPTVRTFGVGMFGFGSGWFNTTCGKAIVHSRSTVNVIVQLRDRDYKIIVGPDRNKLDQLVSLLTSR